VDDLLVNKIAKVRSRMKSLENELLSINTVLLSVQACVRMIDIPEAVDQDQELSSDLKFYDALKK